MEVQGAAFVSNLDLRHGLSLATHLAINDGGSNIVHELGHDLGILIASHVTHTLNTTGYVLEFVLDSFQGAREESMRDQLQRNRNN